jgi:4-alpha-glucanotransferase
VLVLSGRGSGLLLHITSLPSRFGIGDIGPSAYRFVDFLADNLQKYWQILPLNPTSSIHDNSPYNSISAFAWSPLLISPDLLVKEGLLTNQDLEPLPVFTPGFVDYSVVEMYKGELFSRAYRRFLEGNGDHAGYTTFCNDNAWWLSGFALFVALHKKFEEQPWNLWPTEIRNCEPDALEQVRDELAPHIDREQFLQFVFHTQWQALHQYCMKRGVRIIGDMPIFVDYDSADVWMNPELFRLDGSKKPVVVAGVPPDYFSKTGQLWGNPLYDWDAHRRTGFAWWLRRLERTLVYTDLVRIDHFRGLVAYWEVPAEAETAIAGRWVPAPGKEFLDAVKARFPSMPIIAEDLGIITPDVRDLMKQFDLSGMRVLLFTFTDDLQENPNAPHNIPSHVILYTGTHDNAPVRGWYEEEATEEGRKRVADYLGPEVSARDLPDRLIRLAMISGAETTIFPVQDLLGLGMDARLNTPGTRHGNWRWRLSDNLITPDVADRLRLMTRVYRRV